MDERIKPDIQWIDYNFITKSPLIQRKLEDLKFNLFNDKARAKLVEKLTLAGAFDYERKDFYFWNASPYDWSTISYQSRSTDNWDHFFDTIKNIDLSSQYIGLGNFSINAIPEGYVCPKDNGRYDICVNKMYTFINDVFNFDGDQSYGAWNLYPQSKSNLVLPNQIITYLSNSDFREFRRHGYGRNVPVLSRLHEMEDFQPICWEYPIDK